LSGLEAIALSQTLSKSTKEIPEITESLLKVIKQIEHFNREKLKKAFGNYDVEKVFWQIVYTEGIFFGAAFVYWLMDTLAWLIPGEQLPDELQDILGDVFGKYSAYIIMGIPALFLLLEYRRYKKIKGLFK